MWGRAPNATLYAMSEQHCETCGVVVGVDIGGSKVALMVTDVARGADLAYQRYPTPAEAGPEAFIEQLAEAIDGVLDQAGYRRDALRALGVTVPGQVDVERGQVILAGNLAGWQDVPLRTLLQRQFTLPVFIDNDANAAALGEMWRGAAKSMHNFVFLALGTGVGAGVVVNGRLHRGYHNAAGEVGNLLVRRLGRKKERRIWLWQHIGSPAIQRASRRASGRKLGAAKLFARAEADPRLRRVAERLAGYVALAVVDIAAVLDPQAIIFGGGTAAAGELLIERVRRLAVARLPVMPELIRAALGEDAQLHGAVFGALWELNPSLALREELR
jgi:glucokinase